MNIHEWAARWGLPQQAIDELIVMSLPSSGFTHDTEGATQQQIRLQASRNRAALWRNNSGAVTTDDGRHIRFGLGNDSVKINKFFKSSDLIGITPILIDWQHVGLTFGVFTAVEVKRGSWRWSGNEREQAQLNFLNLVQSKGGLATFATSKEDYTKCTSALG